MQTIKSVKKDRYEITLKQYTSGAYVIGIKQAGKEPTTTEAIQDLATASAIFDGRLIMLEGH